MPGLGWWALGLGALLFAAGSLARARPPRMPRWSAPKVLAGAGVTVVAVALGGLLTTVRNDPVPEQRGIGISVEKVNFAPGRSDVGFSLAVAVTVTSCGDDVTVKMTLAPTAEFWIDNHRRFQDRAIVFVTVPDAGLTDVEVSTDDPQADAAVPVVAPQQTVTTAEPTVPTVTEMRTDDEHDFTHLTVEIPKWGSTLRPLTVSFDADWTQRRSWLGGCYVSLPALAGPPTVLSAAAARGLAVPLTETPPGRQTFFTVSSSQADLHAHYNKRFETARGVMTLSLNSHVVDDAATLPSPDTNFGGAPTWTCRTTVASSFDSLANLDPGDPLSGEILYTPQGKPAFSADRLSELLEQRTCASYAAITPSGSGAVRDLVLISIGALFSLGIELALAGTRGGRVPHHGPRSSGPRGTVRERLRRTPR